MKTAPLLCGSMLALAVPTFAQSVTDPHITTWLTSRSAQYARVYETTSDRSSGNAASTWPRSGLTNSGGGQATATYADVQRVAYSANYVYIHTTGLASYSMGNWLSPSGSVFMFWPTNRAAIHRIPRNPTIPTTKPKANGVGGVWVNGVYLWENGDAQSYTTSTGQVSFNGAGIWNRIAGVAEAFNFDPANGHQPSSGAYHTHINPIGLRYQLGDNVTYNATTRTYAEAGTPTKHSPILGWALDGLPVYGPYGYSSPMDAASGVRRMTTGFQKRDGTNGSTNLATTGRTTLPVWAASVQGRSTTLASTEYGPPVNTTYPIGTFAEDYDYLGDLGKTQGVDFDLNRQNVRYCVTPEYPNGTYAYFVCIDASGTTTFPDVINQEFFGSTTGGQGTVSSINEPVTDYKLAGPAGTITVTATASGSGVALAWNSAEGATYKVESSADNATWTTLSSAVTSGGLTTTYTSATASAYYRVTLTAIATYDTGGTYGTPVGKTATVAYALAATAPTITTHPASATVQSGQPASFSVAASGTAPLAYQWQKGGVSLSGATTATYTLASAQASDAGTYTCVVTNSAGTVTSAGATLTVTQPVTAPTITTQPTAVAAITGQSVTFTVVASGTAPLTYQWYKGATAVSGATQASFTLSAVQATDAGTYACVVTNSAGAVTSATAALTVSAATSGGTTSGGTTSGGTTTGGTTTGGTTSGGTTSGGTTTGGTSTSTGSTSGGTSSGGTSTGGTTSGGSTSGGTTGGSGSSTGTTSTGSTGGSTGSGSTGTGTTSSPARLVNLSVRTQAGGSAGTPVAGFVLSGSGAGHKMLIRAVGPGLTDFGVTGALADPQLQLWTGTSLLGSNDNWVSSDSSVFTSVGAFPLTSGSRDAAIVSTLAGGAYTTPVLTPAGSSGVVLLECYDQSAAGDTRLINASARALVGTGDNVLIPGFVISGDGTLKLLIRAVGPRLALFGVDNPLLDPRLTIYRSGVALATNDNWSDSPNAADVQAAAASAGAFSLPAGSQDAALLVSLPAGAYSAVVSGAGSSTGTALVEVYVVP